MIFVGIDPGQTNLAIVAVNEENEILASAKPLSLPIMGVQRLSYLMIFVKDFLDHLPKKDGPVEMICMEGYSNWEKFGREASGETGATIKLALVGWYGLSSPVSYPTIVAPMQLKQFVTGKGNAKKDQMPLSVYKLWQFENPDTNIIEAYALAQVARALCDDQVILNATAKTVLTKLKRNTEWSPNWNFKELVSGKLPKKAATSSPSSGSRTPPTPVPSQVSSQARSTLARGPSSGPSVPVRSIRRLKRASSPVATPENPVRSTSASPRRLLRRPRP